MTRFLSYLLISFVFTLTAKAMDDNNITLVFMGISGVGKSTLINAFYNFAQNIAWDQYPKHFPIRTEFQCCNIKEYQDQNISNYSHGQLSSITQEPFTYSCSYQDVTLKMIDCPGLADTRGIEQDKINTINIAKHMAINNNITAICLILPFTINRNTAEISYCIEEIKGLIPKDMKDRIFICVTHTCYEHDNIKNFVKNADLPINNIFYFDNFAISKDGYTTYDLSNINYTLSCPDDPFADSHLLADEEQYKKVVITKKAKSSWRRSKKTFSKLIEQIKQLDGCYDPYQIMHIAERKETILQLFDELLIISNKLEQYKINLTNTEFEVNKLKTISDLSASNYRKHTEEFDKLFLKLQSDIHQSSNVNRLSSEMAYLNNLSSALIKLMNENHKNKNDLDNKEEELNDIKEEYSNIFRLEQNIKRDICYEYSRLKRISILNINKYLIDYYDICIRKEKDKHKKEKLLFEKNIIKEVYQKI